MTKLNPIKYIENMLSHHPKSFYLWITDGIVIDDKRYIIKEFRLKDGKLYAVISENKYNPKYFEVQLSPDEETLKAIYKAIEDNKIAIKTEIADRKNEITRVDAAIKANTTKINQEITDRKSEIARVDKAINANTTKINQEITDRKNEITRVDGAIKANTTKINQEITDRTNEISRVDAAIKANTAKINKEITDRTGEIARVDAAINKEITDRKSEVTRVENIVKSNTAKIDKEITDRTSEVARLDKAIKDNKGSIDQEVTSINNAINANTTKINQEITNRQNEINRVDEAVNSNTTKINQEIADRKSEITRLNTAIDSNTTKINKEITDRTSEIARVDSAIKANTAKIDKETTDRKSEITRVEGKIPKSAGGRNLALGTSADWSAGWTNFNGGTNQTNVIYRIYNRGFKIGDKVHVRIVLKYSDIVAVGGKTASVITQCAGNVTQWNSGLLDGGTSSNFNGSNGEIEFKGTTVVDEHIVKNEYWNWQLRVDYVASGKIQWKEAKAEVGDLPTPWLPAPEDYDSKLASVKSEIKQTTDAIAAKATSAQSTADSAVTKANAAQTTANNNANTIGTHTTQINTLNSSLAQKQDKLTAGNGITIQGNVISSTGDAASQDAAIKANTAKINQEITDRKNEINRVEGKIPTNLDALNLMTGTRDWSTKTNNWHMGNGWTTESEEYQGLKVHSTQEGFNGSHQNIFVKSGDILTFSFYAKATKSLSKIKISPQWTGSSVYKAPLAGIKEGNEQITVTSEWKRYSKTVHVTSDGSLQFRTEYDGTAIPDGNKFYVAGLKLAKSSIDTGYSENPADSAGGLNYDNLLTDYGISKTKSGNTTKLGLEYRRVDGGRFDLNNLVNGKVRASDFVNAPSTGWLFVSGYSEGSYAIQRAVKLVDGYNTSYVRRKDSGVWSAWREQVGDKSVIDDINSKITSVEGKIPTSIGTVNLFKGSRDFSGTNWINYGTGVYAEDYQGVKIFKVQSLWNGRSQYFEVKAGEEYVFSAYVKSSAKTDGVTFYLPHDPKQPSAHGSVSFGSNSSQDAIGINLTDKYQRVVIKIKITSDGWIAPRIERANTNAYLFFGGYKLERGKIASDWSPAPEDYDTKLATVKSELTTKVTSAQSTADSAVTKANAAQSTANTAKTTADSNTKTIGTHTTQINSLSSRVTTLENKVAELERNAFKTYNIDATNYSGYYSLCSGAVIQYKVMAKTGKYIDLSDFTYSTGTDPLASAKLYSQSLSVDFEVTDTIGQTYVTNRTARFTINDQHKIVIDPKSTVTGLINNLSKVKAFTLL